jgi:hypothetical protein
MAAKAADESSCIAELDFVRSWNRRDSPKNARQILGEPFFHVVPQMRHDKILGGPFEVIYIALQREYAGGRRMGRWRNVTSDATPPIAVPEWIESS